MEKNRHTSELNVSEDFQKRLRKFCNSKSGLFKDKPIFNDIHYNHYSNCFNQIANNWRYNFLKKFKIKGQEFQTLSEIEVFSLFPNKNLEIKRTNGQTPDFILKLNRDIIVDVYSAMHLLNSQKVGFDPGGPAKIVGEVTHHLRAALKDKFQKYSGYPLVVIINKNYSFIDFDQIPYLDLTDYNGHENLSGFVLYESMQINGKVKFRFEVVPYKNTKYLLSEKEVKFIENAFGKAYP
tara:strand:- start:1971 stop:2681 length:711 start_codon:yes stop_codon:yes gene_type:complete